MDEQRRAVIRREKGISQPKEEYGGQKFGKSAQSNDYEKNSHRGANLRKHWGQACSDGNTQLPSETSEDAESMKNPVPELDPSKNADRPHKIVRQPKVEENEPPENESSPSSESPASVAILENDYADGKSSSIVNGGDSSNGFETEKSRKSKSSASPKAIRTEPYSSLSSVEDLPRDGSKELSFRKNPAMVPQAETESLDQSSFKKDYHSPNSHCLEACECCPIILPARLSAQQRELKKIALEVNERKKTQTNKTSPTSRKGQMISANELIRVSPKSEVEETIKPGSKGPSSRSSNSPKQFGEDHPVSVRRSRSPSSQTSTSRKFSPTGKELTKQRMPNATRSPSAKFENQTIAVQTQRSRRNTIPANPPPTPASPVNTQGLVKDRLSTSNRLYHVKKRLNLSPSKIKGLIEGGPPSGSTRSKTAVRKRPLSSSSNSSSSSSRGKKSLKNRGDKSRQGPTKQNRSITGSDIERSGSSSRSGQSSGRGKRRERSKPNVDDAKHAQGRKATNFVTKKKAGSNAKKPRNHPDETRSIHGGDSEATRSSSRSRQSPRRGNRRVSPRHNVGRRSAPGSKAVKFASKSRPGKNYRKSRSPAVQSRSHNNAFISSDSESSRSSSQSERSPQRGSKGHSKAVDRKASRALKFSKELSKSKPGTSSNRPHSSSRYSSFDASGASTSKAGPSTKDRAGPKQHKPSGSDLPRKRGPKETQRRHGGESDRRRKTRNE